MCMEENYDGEWEIVDMGKEKIILMVGLVFKYLMLQMTVF